MRHFLNGEEITPRDIELIGFKSNWSESISLEDRDGRELALNVDAVTLPLRGRDIINEWVSTNGVFQGIPYQIKLNDTTFVDYYVDLVDPSTKFRDYDITVKIKRRKSQDNFFELAQGASFESLAFKGVDFSKFDVPYIIITQNSMEVGVTLSLSIFVMGKAIAEGIHKTAELVAEVVQSFVPSVGLGVVVNIGAIALAIIKLVLQVAYLILLIIATKKLADQLFELIFPRVRNFKATKIKTLIEKSCNHFGYTLSSGLLDGLSGLTILPVPLVPEKYKGFKAFLDYIQNDLNFAYTKGFPTAQDTTPTLWSLIQEIEKIFNAKTRVINGVVQIERRDFFDNNSTAQIPTPLTLQDSRQNEYSLNTFDTWKRYYIHYQPDYADFNTLDNFDNSDIEYSTEPVNVVNTDLVTIKGLQDMSILFALGTRKIDLNWLEKRAKSLFKFIDKLANTSYESLIDDRVGVLVVSNQFYGMSKLLYTVNGKQPTNFTDYISPAALWNNYHNINQIQTNGYKIKESVKILMNENIYVNLLNNNWVEIGGVVCELISLEYKQRDSFATITYKEPFNYANGNVTTLLING